MPSGLPKDDASWDEGVSELVTDKSLKHMSYREIVDSGYIPVIANLAMEGMPSLAISVFLEETYGLYVPENVIEKLHPASKANLGEVWRRREAATLQVEAHRMKQKFETKMLELMDRERPDLSAVKVLGNEYRQWWDRVGKFVLPQDQFNLNVNQNNVTVNDPVQILLEMAEKDPKYADIIDGVIEKMKGGKP